MNQAMLHIVFTEVLVRIIALTLNERTADATAVLSQKGGEEKSLYSSTLAQ